ncbi:MAG: hypothetical protein K9L24_02055 [Spirochaetia bacterium]|nr:hypothetical protein [Spirochaetia bacterium]MCF7953076.1 hypothetical protein [Spirochaetales bacterium]
MAKENVPSVHFYDQDFVEIYDRTWVWIQDFWKTADSENGFKGTFLGYPDQGTYNQYYSIISSFFLAYSNEKYSPAPMLDFFYSMQEPDGAIRGEYSMEDGSPVFHEDNPEGVQPPLFSFAEFNLYHKMGNKRRLKEIVPALQYYYQWLENTFKQENGLYAVPPAATMMNNAVGEHVRYSLEFNTQQALNALYLSAIGDILNDKELSFQYKRLYFTLKTRINSLMWNQDDSIYYSLDENGKQICVKTIGAFWTLLAEIPNEYRVEELIRHLKDQESFGTENPFPTIAVDEPEFSENGEGYHGSVVPFLTYMVIKGLERYQRYDFARECAIRHLYFMLDTLHPDGKEIGDVYEAYKPLQEGAPVWTGHPEFPRKKFLPMVGISTITMMIENVLGFEISLPKKTVDWVMPTLEAMGIENLSLKRNLITVLSSKNLRGWEIRLESEKLYYFTIDILDEKKNKTLPIPSGKCSMLIDKL